MNSQFFQVNCWWWSKIIKIDAVKSLPFVRFIPYMCIVLYGTCPVTQHDVSYFLNDVFFEKLSLFFIIFKSIMVCSLALLCFLSEPIYKIVNAMKSRIEDESWVFPNIQEEVESTNAAEPSPLVYVNVNELCRRSERSNQQRGLHWIVTNCGYSISFICCASTIIMLVLLVFVFLVKFIIIKPYMGRELELVRYEIEHLKNLISIDNKQRIAIDRENWNRLLVLVSTLHIMPLIEIDQQQEERCLNEDDYHRTSDNRTSSIDLLIPARRIMLPALRKSSETFSKILEMLRAKLDGISTSERFLSMVGTIKKVKGIIIDKLNLALQQFSVFMKGLTLKKKKEEFQIFLFDLTSRSQSFVMRLVTIVDNTCRRRKQHKRSTCNKNK